MNEHGDTSNTKRARLDLTARKGATLSVVAFTPSMKVEVDSHIIIADDPSLLHNASVNIIQGDTSFAHYTANLTAGGSQDYITATAGGTRISIFITPSKCGRHNTSSNSHSISSFLKGRKRNMSMSRVSVLVLSSSLQHAYAQVAETYRHFPHFSMKTNPSDTAADREVTIIVSAPGVNESFLCQLRSVGDGIRLCQYLVDAPPNVINVNAYVEECKVVASRTGCKIEVIRGTDLRDRGFGGLWGVGMASVELPALVILSSINTDASSNMKSICLVGKGIVFDTGGLSVKTGGGMVGMKRDMGGSSAVLGAFEALVTATVTDIPVHALLCIAENSISAPSTRPDDILTLYSKKTVEVNNIDAEGRLVLADGCSYAYQHLNPSHIIDIATLTGAQGIATGKKHAAIYTNDEDLEIAAVLSGKTSGDLVHPMPYVPEFFAPEFSSEFADMTNSVSDRSNAQCSCAAQFIGNHIDKFLDNGGKWLHIDMAYPVHAGERATGYGVALLYDIVKNIKN